MSINTEFLRFILKPSKNTQPLSIYTDTLSVYIQVLNIYVEPLSIYIQFSGFIPKNEYIY